MFAPQIWNATVFKGEADDLVFMGGSIYYPKSGTVLATGATTVIEAGSRYISISTPFLDFARVGAGETCELSGTGAQGRL
jgi:hypothetical protein